MSRRSRRQSAQTAKAAPVSARPGAGANSIQIPQELATVIEQARQANRQRNHAVAWAGYARALQAWPGKPPAALIAESVGPLNELRHYAMARRVLEQGLTHYPDNGWLLLRLGEVHQNLGNEQLSLEAYRSAEQQPEMTSRAVFGTAQIHERLHRLDEAAEVANRAVSLEPDQPQLRLLSAKIERRRKNHTASEAAIKAVLDHVEDPRFRYRALFERAYLLEDQEDYDAAWRAYEEAKAAQAPLANPLKAQAKNSTVRANGAFESLTSERLTSWASQATADERPDTAFLIGHPRSGTTMTEQALAAHSKIRCLDERMLAPAVDSGLCRTIAGPERAPTLVLKPDRLNRVTDAMRERSRKAHRLEASRVMDEELDDLMLVDKQPEALLVLPTLLRVFPGAPILMALRDPRDVVLSCFVQCLGVTPMSQHWRTIDGAMDFAAWMLGLWVGIRDRLVTPYLEVRYEDTVQDLESQTRRLTETLQLEWEPAMVTFHERSREKMVSTPSYAQVNEAVHTKAIGKWRRYEKYLNPHMDRLAPTLQALGYDH